MRALVISGPGEHCVQLIPRPAITDAADAIVAVSHVALCGTDLRLLAGTVHDAEYPMVPGHEWSGVVREAPSDPGLIGQLVVGSNFIPCGECAWCGEGRQQLCPSLHEVGFSMPGACADFVRLPAANLRPLPSQISPAQGCLTEPLCVAVHAVDRAGDIAGRRAAVLGGGAVGLLIGQVAMASGAADVTIVEPVADRRAIAIELGLAATEPTASQPGSRAPEVVFDATGTASGFTAALDLVRPGGKVVLVGYSSTESTPIAPSIVMLKELEVAGVLSGYGMLPAALELIRAGSVILAPLARLQWPFADYRSAINDSTALRQVLAVAGT